RNRRGGRGGRDRDETRVGEADGQAGADAPTEETAAALNAGDLAPVEAGRNEETPAVDPNQPAESGEGRRRGRGRDRNRRERTADELTTTAGFAAGDGAQRPDAPSNAPSNAPMLPDEPRAEHRDSVPTEPQRIEASVEAASPFAAIPDVMPSGTAPQPVPAAPEPIPQTAGPFVLPLGTLEAIAESAGLQWVNSDAEKIRAVQEAMANQPPPLHVPREKKAAAATDEGPLVLVETRKDLSQFKLPFETVQQETQGRV
ncbi:MAG TPA: ribonuclease E/G, partial [Caldimonas sp.]